MEKLGLERTLDAVIIKRGIINVEIPIPDFAMITVLCVFGHSDIWELCLCYQEQLR
jgi:hypothetical protein